MAKRKAEVAIVSGETKSGIKYQLDPRLKDDARLLYLLTQLQKEEVRNDPMEASKAAFNLFELIMGSGEGLAAFMNEVAAVHGGVCETSVMLAEIQEMLGSLNIKNS